MNYIKSVFLSCLVFPALTFAGYVTIGDINNESMNPWYPDRVQAIVGYEYNISQYEVSAAEFGEYSKSVDGYATHGATGPAVWIGLYDAMAYCNYLTMQGGAEKGAYTFTDDGVLIDRDVSVSTTAIGSFVYVLPTVDEWNKAAYYNCTSDTWSSDFAHGSSVDQNDARFGVGTTWDVTSGTEESNGTFNMDGNVSEWIEDADGVTLGSSYVNGVDLVGTDASARGFLGGDTVGLRVVQLEGTKVVPEPATASLCLVAGLIGFMVRRFQAI